MTNFAIIVAAGSGTRAGGDLPKQYQKIGNKAVLGHAIEAFVNHAEIDGVIVVISDEHKALYAAAAHQYGLPAPTTGGPTRQQSVLNGLKALQSHAPNNVLIHDAARPFVSAQTISAVISGIKPGNCALPGVKIVDTVAQVQNDRVVQKLERDSLRAVQTPQGFAYKTILLAHEAAAAKNDFSASDDSSLVSDVVIVAGDDANIKLTTNADITLADARMKKMKLNELPDIRVGQGFDVHAFEPGDHVVLCGVKIPFAKKLKGHSDADVAMHTLTDAILGAISQGDIGKHFPPSEPQWKGAASEIFLKKAIDLVSDQGGMLAHCDITVICEAPKLRPHIDDMRKKLAQIIDCDEKQVSVKATTSEKLGFTGRGEGIAAMATATVRLPA